MICNVDTVTKWSLQTKAFYRLHSSWMQTKGEEQFFYGAFMHLAFFPNNRRPIKKSCYFLGWIDQKNKQKKNAKKNTSA